MTNKKVDIVYTGKVADDVVAGWKKTHGQDRVFVLEIPISNGEVSIGYFRKPNRTHIARAMSLVMQNQPVEAGESILTDTYLGGDARIASIEDADTDIHVGAAWKLYEATKIFEAHIKNA